MVENTFGNMANKIHIFINVINLESKKMEIISLPLQPYKIFCAETMNLLIYLWDKRAIADGTVSSGF